MRPYGDVPNAFFAQDVTMYIEQEQALCPDVVREAELAAIVELYRAGRLADIEERARSMTERYPEDVFGWNVLGSICLQQRHAQQALPSLDRAIMLSPESSDLYNNRGIALMQLDRLDEALANFRKAVRLRPSSAMAHSNLGSVLEALGRPEESIVSYLRALAVRPDYAKARYNLGNVYKDLGRLDEAEVNYRKALAIDPDYVDALVNCGITLKDRGWLDEAEGFARRAVAVAPDLVEAWNLLTAILLARQDDPTDALDAVMHSLWIEERPDNRRLFVTCARRLELAHMDATVQRTIIRAMSEPWARPGELTAVATRCVLDDPTISACVTRAVLAWPRRLSAEELYGFFGLEAVCGHAMLQSLLKTAPVCSLELERLLTMARSVLLATAWQGAKVLTSGLLEFYAALACQCAINEYVFAVTEAEADQVRTLSASLSAALTAGTAVPVLWPVAVAAYVPLYRLEGAERLLERLWPEPVRAVLTQDLLEPLEARALRKTMPRLTPIEDEVSRQVRRQYEENPYPRWVKAAPADTPRPFDAVMRQCHPRAVFQPLGLREPLDILIAGCGTGQHALETARRYEGARVLAVDLSLSSLCYAKRKTQEIGVTNITYAQADILRLGELSRRFDVIESSGVLHHLADPLAGWRVLLALLRPGGFMRLGLYSRLARRDITRLRGRIATLGYTATVDGIRHCRQDLMDRQPDEEWKSIFLSDFYSISGCRDLLFHVQEHCLTLPEIAAFLAASGMSFVGFEIDAGVLADYWQRFPEDRAAVRLENWAAFEADHPDTFVEMYQFWVQKPL